MLKPTMMTGNHQSPVMYIPMSCPSSDNVMETQVYNRKQIEPDAGRQPDLLGGERFHIPLISRNQNEQVDESEETIINFYHSGDETGQSPYDQHGRGQREVVFASERLQSLGQEGEERQEYGVGGGVPPYAHAQRHDAFHHEFHTEIGSVEHEVERYEDKAPEQELAFHDPYALQVGFDGLFLVEEEPCGDGEEDDDADLAAAGHDELEEDPFRSQGEFQHVIAVMDDKMTHQNHEHRDDAQQFDAGIPLPPPFKFLERAGATRLICAPFKPVSWLFSFIVLLLSPSPSLSRKFYGGWGDCIRGVLLFSRSLILNWGGNGIRDGSGRRFSFPPDCFDLTEYRPWFCEL